METNDGIDPALGYKRKRTDYNYNDPFSGVLDPYGNARQVTTSGTNTASRVTTTNFAYNTAAYIVNRPYYTTTTVGSTTINNTWFDYDGQANGTAPTKGDLTREKRWLSLPTSTPPVTVQHFYDVNNGNRIGTIDAKGNKCAITTSSGYGYTSKTVYDSTYQTFPVTETNALCQQVTKTYWGINTALSASSVDRAAVVPGLLATVTDPNNVRTDSYYDSLGRPKATVIPPDTATYPTSIYEYLWDGTAPEMTLVQQKEQTGTFNSLESYTYVDGFGRTVQTKSEGETAGQWITVNTTYNKRGLVETVSVPHHTTSSGYTTPLTQPKTTTLYDAVRRPVEIRNSDHTTTSPSKRTLAYSLWVVTTTNEKGIATTREYDALGRLVRVTEPAPGGTTLYSYDTFHPIGSNVLKVTDAAGNITTTVFDTLGRKIAQSDPDLGSCGNLAILTPYAFFPWYPTPCWNYQYDANGNLLKQRNAKGQEIAFTYDALNRILTKTLTAVLAPCGPLKFTATLTAQQTVIALQHFLDLRDDVNTVRARAGQGAFTWTPPAPALQDIVRAQHLIDLRTNLDAALSALGRTRPPYTDDNNSTLTQQWIKKAHLDELRTQIQAACGS